MRINIKVIMMKRRQNIKKVNVENRFRRDSSSTKLNEMFQSEWIRRNERNSRIYSSKGSDKQPKKSF